VSLTRIRALVVVAVIELTVVTVVLQSLRLAPAMKVVR
jgi:hypothetical protein